MQLVFDGHNDSLLRLYLHCASDPAAFVEGLDEGDRRAVGQLDLPRALKGGFAGGFFAVFVPPLRDLDLSGEESELPRGWDEPVPQEPALRVTMEIISLYHRLLRAAGSRLAPVHGRADLTIESGRVLSLLHLEGAEAVDPELRNLESLFAAGVRSIGPVWSRPNAFGHGVPFRFPGSPDTGPGLTPAGRDLLRACAELGMVVDLSHLNEKGFWDAARDARGPLVATHACAHALSPSSRNLTDDQLRAVRDSDGVVGLNFHVGDLRREGKITRELPIERLVEHLAALSRRHGASATWRWARTSTAL